MPKKPITYPLKDIDADYWQTVREFAVHRRMSLKTLVILALDQHMARYPQNTQNQTKET